MTLKKVSFGYIQIVCLEEPRKVHIQKNIDFNWCRTASTNIRIVNIEDMARKAKLLGKCEYLDFCQTKKSINRSTRIKSIEALAKKKKLMLSSDVHLIIL